MKEMRKLTRRIAEKTKAYFEFCSEAEREAYQAAISNAENDFELGLMMSSMMYNQYRML